jgi:hypothetical protein
MQTARSIATLEPVRFGEFLLARRQITDEQWLAALAEHWSKAATGRYQRIGNTIVDHGFLARETVEAEAQAFHDGIDVVEVADHRPRSERMTLEMPVNKSGRGKPDRC